MHIQVHFSIDGIGKQHDEIRVVEGGFDKLLQSVEQVRALQKFYPKLITKLEETNQWQTPCRVGSKMIEIGHDGTIFPCEILNVNFGLIQDFNYDIRKILAQDKVKKFVKDIVDEKCKCTWECALKNNMLYDPSKYPLLAKEYISLLIRKN